MIASGALALTPRSVLAQPRAPKVGLLMAANPVTAKANLDAFQQGLRELNYLEGRNIVVEYRWAEGDLSRLPGLARDLVQQKVDVIVAGGTSGGQAARNATREIPIVSAGTAELAESGLVASLSQPGGNVTGAAVAFPETAGKQIEIMKEILSRPKNAAVLWPGAGTEFFSRQRREVESAASGLALTWHACEQRRELEQSLAAVAKSRPDFLVVLSSTFFFANRRELVRFARDTRIPAVYGFREYVDDGGLISYGASIRESFRRAAGYVDRILKGAKPADLPVQLPSKLELVVNLAAAKAIGLQIPRSILLRADAVIGSV